MYYIYIILLYNPYVILGVDCFQRITKCTFASNVARVTSTSKDSFVTKDTNVPLLLVHFPVITAVLKPAETIS